MSLSLHSNSTSVSPATRCVPNSDQLSVIAATIILTYAIAGLITLPERELRFEFWNLYVVFSINARMLVTVVAALMAGFGADWLIRNHPLWNRKSTLEHWLLPLLTALVLGFLTGQLEYDLYGWIGYFLGAGFLVGVLVAEYIAVSPTDSRYPLAISVLTATSYLLYILFCILLRIFYFRLLLLLPSLFLATLLVSLRNLRLRFPYGWAFPEALLISIPVLQLASALHYWPISELAYGLALLGAAYALFQTVCWLKSNPAKRIGFLEPLILLFLTWLLAYWLEQR